MNNIKTEINSYKQNKPSYIVDDIIRRYPEVDPDFIFDTLLKRGVFKWLAVRRDIIKLKTQWKKEVRELNRRKSDKEIGYLHALEKCRGEVRALCHSNRFRAPDFDRISVEFLDKRR